MPWARAGRCGLQLLPERLQLGVGVGVLLYLAPGCKCLALGFVATGLAQQRKPRQRFLLWVGLQLLGGHRAHGGGLLTIGAVWPNDDRGHWQRMLIILRTIFKYVATEG
ncbi:hypothetical protein D3C71_1505800 [compost metagenome]